MQTVGPATEPAAKQAGSSWATGTRGTEKFCRSPRNQAERGCQQCAVQARAVANRTDACFIRVIGSELVQKYVGEGARMVRELFQMARSKKACLIFFDEVDAIGGARHDDGAGKLPALALVTGLAALLALVWLHLVICCPVLVQACMCASRWHTPPHLPSAAGLSTVPAVSGSSLRMPHSEFGAASTHSLIKAGTVPPYTE